VLIPNLYFYPAGHPSHRHSMLDVSQVNYKTFPLARHALGKGVKLILKPGEALVIPKFWLHHITTLTPRSLSVAVRWLAREQICPAHHVQVYHIMACCRRLDYRRNRHGIYF
jgi:hypothetical protein